MGKAISEMETILRNRGYKDFKDFLVDKRMLKEWYSPNAKWLWILTPYEGTELIRLGAHAKESSWGIAAIGCHGNRAAYFLVDGDNNVAPLTIEKAGELLRDNKYDCRNGIVFRGEEKIARVVSRTSRPTARDNRYSGRFIFDSITQLTADDVVALRYMALGLLVKEHSTVFVQVDSITIDGLDIRDKLEEMLGASIVDQP